MIKLQNKTFEYIRRCQTVTNEEFQKLVLKDLGSIKEDINGLKEDVSGLKEDVGSLKEDVSSLKAGQARIEVRLEKVEVKLENVENRLERVETKLDAVHEQTAVLTEFRTDTNMKLDYLLEGNKSIHEIIGRHEVDITSLRRRAV